MGTGYKGNATYYRSIGQNILSASSKYQYRNGYFGTSSPRGGPKTRNISAVDNLGAATDFYNRIAYGGKEKVYNENLRITTMSDGTIITMRKKQRQMVRRMSISTYQEVEELAESRNKKPTL